MKMNVWTHKNSIYDLFYIWRLRYIFVSVIKKIFILPFNIPMSLVANARCGIFPRVISKKLYIFSTLSGTKHIANFLNYGERYYENLEVPAVHLVSFLVFILIHESLLFARCTIGSLAGKVQWTSDGFALGYDQATIKSYCSKCRAK